MNPKTILSAYGKASERAGFLGGISSHTTFRKKEMHTLDIATIRSKQAARFRKALEERLDFIQTVSEESLNLIKDLIDDQHT